MEEMWIARDRNGILIISIGGYYDININLFPQITFDNSPQKITIDLL